MEMQLTQTRPRIIGSSVKLVLGLFVAALGLLATRLYRKALR